MTTPSIETQLLNLVGKDVWIIDKSHIEHYLILAKEILLTTNVQFYAKTFHGKRHFIKFDSLDVEKIDENIIWLN